MRLYIADLNAYNNGRLVGEWVTLSDYNDYDELSEYIKKSILQPGGEEWATHDYELPFKLDSEYPDYEILIEIAHWYESADDNEKIGFLAYLENGHDLSDALENARSGEFNVIEMGWGNADKTVGEYWLYESGCYDLDKMGDLAGYIDVEAFGRDRILNGSYVEVAFNDDNYIVELHN